MDLIPYFPGLHIVLNERYHSLEFVHAPSLESRRIVEDEPWVALKDEFITNIVDPSLWHQISFIITEVHKDHRAGTLSVGLICRKKKKIRRYQAKLVTYPVINWILLCIADLLEQHHFPSIFPTDNEGMEVGVFGSDSCNVLLLGHALRSKSEDLCHSIDKFLRLFGSLWVHSLTILMWVSRRHFGGFNI